MARLRTNLGSEVTEPDMTPMIDMVFQLIAFFMVLVNFSTDEQNQKISLPQSELATPSTGKLEFPIVINLDVGGVIYMGANTTSVDALRPMLNTEVSVLQSQGKTASDGNIIIRAHKDAAGGVLQELIAKCQEAGFERFVLRVKEEDPS